jgi:hypothetical protein
MALARSGDGVVSEEKDLLIDSQDSVQHGPKASAACTALGAQEE